MKFKLSRSALELESRYTKPPILLIELAVPLNLCCSAFELVLHNRDVAARMLTSIVIYTVNLCRCKSLLPPLLKDRNMRSSALLEQQHSV